ncbi:MAG: KH domain-containing protein [Archaeoglobaceae archaeon]
MRIEIEVPQERVAAIIGKSGEVKKKIEEKGKCKLKINGNIVEVEYEDSVSFLRVRDVITAIAKGFSPEVALKLFDDEMMVLEVIDLSNLVSDKALPRVKGRIIGSEGKMKNQIETTLDVNLSITDKYVAIIGNSENVAAAREAIMMLVDGAQHSTVLKFMERKRREMKSREFEWL